MYLKVHLRRSFAVGKEHIQSRNKLVLHHTAVFRSVCDVTHNLSDLARHGALPIEFHSNKTFQVRSFCTIIQAMGTRIR
jgi:hypothetical protein